MPKSSSKRKKGAKVELARWSPDDYARTIDRAFYDLSRRFERPFFQFDNSWLAPYLRPFEMLPEARRPFADLIDAGNEYRVRAEVPGIPKEKLNISVSPRGIRIEGESSTKIDENKEGYVHRERAYSKIQRSLVFPEEVNPESADASVKDGILEVVVAKKTPTETKTHKVQVK